MKKTIRIEASVIDEKSKTGVEVFFKEYKIPEDKVENEVDFLKNFLGGMSVEL